MATELLNKQAYEIDADNLVLSAQYPLLHRTITIANPNVALERGMAVVNASGTLHVAGEKEGDATIAGAIVAIVVADHDADAESETVEVDAYVSGAFNASAVKTLEELDISTAAYVLGAQGNGIYLL